ncbi:MULTISPECIES: sporulation membrane protein YtrI [Gracilibacillus]|uniref:sporulation membrane protein YtrI n=1 Tax=Gracilibacillus TaxID=74385 RepID=UPI000825B3FF|nr:MULTISPECIES: sporulation membrane protein YtrI [Gracilibacillus]
MHIPPYYKRPAWQRFLAGVALGSIIGYFIFLYMFGSLQQQWIEEKIALRTRYQDLYQNYTTLVQNHQKLDQQTKEGVQITEIEIEFLNLEQLDLANDRLMRHQLEEAIREEAGQAIGKKVEDMTESIDFLIATVENKTIRIDDFRFQATVSRMVVSETLYLSIELTKAD